ncbi:MAG: hypothetical protein OIF51_01565 [Cellvibrionaceae bacterium]|nr:hypothetical protein [Cellvibrionaceae bacterium]
MKIKALVLLLLSLSSSYSLACSFAQMLQDFEVKEGIGKPPQKPGFIVHKIHRGTDDGEFSSCSDAGIITLKLSAPQTESVGYIFEIVEGEFEDQLFLGNPVEATSRFKKDGLYKFIWLDGSSVEQEPINITVKIEAVTTTGQRSEPQLLNVLHPGVKKPWWKIW